MNGLIGSGWIPDLPDDRDYTPSTKGVSLFLEKIKLPHPKAIPSTIDFRADFPPVFQQGSTNSCTAQAASAIISYFEYQAFKKYYLPSRLFIYKATRNLINQSQDNGAFMRTTMQALRIFGAPPEAYWPFVANSVNVEPPAFCYAFGERFQTLAYYRYERKGESKEHLLRTIKTQLAAKLPSVFGFYLFRSIATATEGKIPYPSSDERPVGGHAVTAVGYSDDMIITHPLTGTKTEGAILIRNSWGELWGQRGYGWLPYDYVLGDLATDWWSLLDAKWIDSTDFMIETESTEKSRPRR